jgi:hypothetical protein
MSKANPEPFIMGGYAEDALLYGRETRPHSDIDWIIPRDKLTEYDRVAKGLGFSKRGTYGKTAAGEPFYIAWTDDESFWIECVVVDMENDSPYIEIAELNFDTTGLPPLKPFRIYLPPDTFEYGQTLFEDFKIKTASPLAIYQIRTGLNVYKTFGELRDKDKLAMKALKDKFFPNISQSQLIPRTTLLKS